MRSTVLTVLLCLACLRAMADPIAPPPGRTGLLCQQAIESAGRAHAVPAGLMAAIGRVESGRQDPVTGALHPWPWTVDAEGQGTFYDSKDQAIAAVRALQARGVRSIDVGCMQVNLMFHPAAFASLEEAFDPRANALYAAHFLNALHAGSHDWSGAIGAYHSQTQALGDDYRRRVLALWQDPSANWQLGLAVAYRDFAQRGEAYNDFAPRSVVYGAFAVPGADRSIALRR